jgi:hypothetical protein
MEGIELNLLVFIQLSNLVWLSCLSYTNDVSDVYDFQTSVSFYFSEKNHSINVFWRFFLRFDCINDLIIRDNNTLLYYFWHCSVKLFPRKHLVNMQCNQHIPPGIDQKITKSPISPQFPQKIQAVKQDKVWNPPSLKIWDRKTSRMDHLTCGCDTA